jgi:molecular chaperone GrpE
MDNNKDQVNIGTDNGGTDINVDQVKKLEERVLELENNWKRALADYKNLERRTAEEKQEFAEFANMILIQRLLPIVDNLEMLEKHVHDTGLKMIVKELKQVLEDNGVTAVESDGKEFDSATMDCIETVESKEKDHNKVTETVARGYRFKDKVLRPAKVRVGKAKV